MAAETKPARFLIEGREYEIPHVVDFNLDEAQVLYDHTGFVVEDFVTDDDEELTRMSRHPGFMRTMLHVAYQRGNPTLSRVKVEKLIGAQNAFTSAHIVGTVEQEDDADDPPVSTSKPVEPNENGLLENESGTGSSTPTPGSDSSTGSTEPGTAPNGTTASRSGTSSPALLRTRSAA